MSEPQEDEPKQEETKNGSDIEIDEGEIMQLFQGVCNGELSFGEAKEALESMYPGKDMKDVFSKIAQKFFRNSFNFGNTAGAAEQPEGGSFPEGIQKLI